MANSNLPRFTFNDQEGLAHLILTHPHVCEHVGIVEQHKVNMYPYMYHDGDLLVHFAGCRYSNTDCDQQAVDFWNRRTVVGSDVPKNV